MWDGVGAYKIITGILASLLLSLLAYFGGQLSMAADLSEIRQDIKHIQERMMQPNPAVIAKLDGLEKRMDDLIRRMEK